MAAHGVAERTRWLAVFAGGFLLLLLSFASCGRSSGIDSAFRADVTTELLADWKVFSLLSPVRMPRYNGACEAGIGVLKTYASWEAARHGRAGCWTSDDLEGARLRANATARPGPTGPSIPQILWDGRQPLAAGARSAFADAVAVCRREAFAHYGLAPGAPLTSRQKDAVDRFAVSRALVARGFLSFTRRRITPPISSVFRARIT